MKLFNLRAYKIFFVFVLAIVLSLSSCILKNDLEKFLSEWQPANTSSTAYVIRNKCMMIGEQTINAAEYIGDYYGKTAENTSIHAVCIYDNCLYALHFSYYSRYDEEGQIDFSEPYNQKIAVCSIDLNTLEVLELYSDNFYPKSVVGTRRFQAFQDCRYYEGSIFLCDGAKTVRFDMENSTIEKFTAEYFEKMDFGYTAVRNAQTNELYIFEGEDTHVTSVETLVMQNPYLSEVRKREIPLQLADVYVMNGNTYLVFEVRDRDNECTALIFRYDQEYEEIEYLYHYFTNENVSSTQIYPIPVVFVE